MKNMNIKNVVNVFFGILSVFIFLFLVFAPAVYAQKFHFLIPVFIILCITGIIINRKDPALTDSSRILIYLYAVLLTAWIVYFSLLIRVFIC